MLILLISKISKLERRFLTYCWLLDYVGTSNTSSGVSQNKLLYSGKLYHRLSLIWEMSVCCCLLKTVRAVFNSFCPSYSACIRARRSATFFSEPWSLLRVSPICSCTSLSWSIEELQDKLCVFLGLISEKSSKRDF